MRFCQKYMGDFIGLSIGNFTFSILAVRALTDSNALGVADSNGTLVGSANGALGTTLGFTGNVGNVNNHFGFDLTGNAGAAIDSIDKMLAEVDEQRAALGSIQNRLESAIRVQSNVATNESDARSRIRDTDFAEESANLSQQSIIQQAATSMLMQANARPQIGLSLLG